MKKIILALFVLAFMSCKSNKIGLYQWKVMAINNNEVTCRLCCKGVITNRYCDAPKIEDPCVCEETGIELYRLPMKKVFGFLWCLVVGCQPGRELFISSSIEVDECARCGRNVTTYLKKQGND